MSQRIRLSAILIFIFFVATHSKAQDNLLDRTINLRSDNLSVKYALNDIAESADFKFSYNTEIINGDSLISYNYNNITVEDCLDNILNDDIRYKVSGDHLILLKVPEKKAKKITHTVSGTIIDFQTKQKIQYVSVYDVDEKYSTITNASGFYKLEVSSADRYRALSFNKKGYFDTIVVIKTIEKSRINIELHPSIKTGLAKSPKLVPLIEEHTLSNFFIPQDIIINANNLAHISDKRFAQVSILPSVGTNLSSYGVVENNISFNILAGYSKSVKGVEIGSLLNIVKENVSGFQMGGLGNMIGGKLTGVQTAGLFNLNTESVKGVQISGLFNTALDTVTGIQLSGFTNILKGKMNGAQIGGFYNMTTENVDGVQLAGFANLALKDVNLMQISGFTNVGDNVNGVQLSGFANISRGKVGGAQIAGFANIAKNVNVAQISGFTNIAYNEIKGVQVSSFFNYAKHVKGLQLGMFNVSDTVSGLSVGFLSFVRKGYHQAELSGNETFCANMAFKTGTKRFYNIFSAGINPTNIFSETIPKWYGGYGFGTEIVTKKRFYTGLDLTVNQIFEDNNYTESFTSLIKLDLNIGFRIFKHSGISFGPSANFLISNHKNAEGNYYSSIAPSYSQTKILSTYLTSTWVGGRLAFRI